VPELPEVETVRRGLEPALLGARLSRIEQRRPDLRFSLPERFAQRLSGCRVEALARRAKYLLMHLSSDETLIMHLGMSGRFTVFKSASGGQAGKLANFVHETTTDPAHDHVVFHTEAGATITYNDPRRFGFMVMARRDELDAHPMLANLGPEPLGSSLTAEQVAGRAYARSVDLKAFLMDQRNIAGLGNIYVCEALYRAGLSPRRRAASLALKTGRPSERAHRLVPAITSVISEAIDAGGSSLRDYAHADGSLGYFQHTFTVYGREGETCRTPGCEGVIQRLVQAGRSTFYCGRCQR